MRRTTLTTTTTAATAGLLAAAALLLAAPALAGSDVHRASGEVTRLSAATPQLVPDGAAARIQSVALADGRMRTTLHLTGFAADRTYGAHGHVAGCAQAGGGHWQFDPTGAVDAVNEIWLDVTTNASGNGHATAVHDQQFRPGTGPGSVILHRHATDAAGKAGDKLACLDADL